jgi:hypothetical protein
MRFEIKNIKSGERLKVKAERLALIEISHLKSHISHLNPVSHLTSHISHLN